LNRLVSGVVALRRAAHPAATVADVLGHESLQTTAIYAKLDLDSLSQLALPWPGGEQ
jgi:site-specific recombinase XerC